MNSDDYYDPDDVVQRSSPMLRPVQPRLKPDTPDGTDDETDIEDVIDNSIPWNPALRNRKRRRSTDRGLQNDRPRNKWKDALLIHQMDPRQGWGLASAVSRTLAPADAVTEPVMDSLTNATPNSRRRKRFVLPLLVASPKISAEGILTEVEACPDSGCDENIISLGLVNQLKVEMQAIQAEPKEFSLANGKVVQALGCVHIACGFAVGTPLPTPSIECVFYVFNTLAVPMIMGMGFLVATETLSKHTDRLLEQTISGMQALRVNSVGKSKRSAACRLDDLVGYATVDTGSDLNFVHPGVVAQGMFTVEPAVEYLEFADCSIGSTSGVFEAQFSIGIEDDSKEFQSRTRSINLEFYVLNNLSTNILIGQDTANDLEVMTAHLDSLLVESANSAVHIIRHQGKLEQRVKRGLKQIKNIFTNSRTGPSQFISYHCNSHPRLTGAGTVTEQETPVTFELQRENAKYEREQLSKIPTGCISQFKPRRFS
ncbi:hypothetical protein ACHAP4_010947 [Fusarium culmorum]